ncbi:MAG TPA: hypothetical protein PKY82_12360 [Pyrinomonadaceae bacterium]|nr:hypothetical protein [Pyrinomonadaceae bacterium]
MKFAKYTFLIAGIYGLIVTIPQYFLETKNGIDYPPAITHPEYYYGFVGVVMAFQIIFLLIGSDPVRYRPLMLISALFEKFPFVIAVYTLYSFGRVHSIMIGLATIDLLLGLLFVISYLKTAKSNS